MRLNMTPEDWSDEEEAIRRVLHVPNMACKLFSILVVGELGYLASFGQGWCFIRDKQRKVVATATLVD